MRVAPPKGSVAYDLAGKAARLARAKQAHRDCDRTGGEELKKRIPNAPDSNNDAQTKARDEVQIPQT
jgi:hypothetical protein